MPLKTLTLYSRGLLIHDVNIWKVFWKSYKMQLFSKLCLEDTVLGEKFQEQYQVMSFVFMPINEGIW